MMLSKKKVFLFIGVLVFGIWGYLVYDVNKRFPEPEEHAVKFNESVDYCGVTTSLTDISYCTLEDLLKIFPVLGDKLEKIYGEDMKYNYDYNYILAKIHLENKSSDTINFRDSGIFISSMTIEFGPHHNGSKGFFNNVMNEDFDGILESGEETDIYTVFGYLKRYLSMEKLKTYDIKICYQFYPEKRYFHYIPDTFEE